MTTTSANFMTVSTTVTVASGAATTANLKTAPFGSVTGTVTNSTTGMPLPDVIVQATQASGEVTSALTDSQGDFQLDGLDAGAYHIVLGDEGTPGVAQTSVTLSPSQATAIANLTIAVAGTLSGTVFEPDGVTPDTTAQVILLSAGQQILTMATDAKGNYTFVVLAGGMYELQANDVGLGFPAIPAITVSGGNKQTGLNFQAGTAQITGIVQDGASSGPVAGATVLITQTGPDPIPVPGQSVTTAADGSFAFPNIVPGTYEIDVIAGTYASASQTLTVTDGTPAQAVFKLSPQAVLQGTIRSAGTGLPLTDATVLLSSTTLPLAGGNAAVDSSGAYEVGGVAPGTYQLLVQAPGYTSVLIGNVTLGTLPTLRNVALNVSSTALGGTVTERGPAHSAA